MIFRRKNQIDISIENSKDLPKDSEFSSLSDTSSNIKLKNKINVKSFFRDSANSIKDEFLNYSNITKQYVKNKKYPIWRLFLSFFSILMLVFSFVMITWPFSYATINNFYSPLSNFYVYDYNHLSITISGLIYVLFFIVWIILLILHIFLYKKFENHKYLKENISSRRDKAFFIIKFLSWSLFIFAFVLLLLMILIPPSTNDSTLNNQMFVNKIVSYVDCDKINLLTQEEKLKFLSLLGVKWDGSGNLDDLVKESRISTYFNDVNVSNLFFYNISLGGVSSLNTVGIVFISFASIFAGLSFILFIAKVANVYMTRENFEKLKLDNIQFNFNDVKENISSINNKIKGIYNTSQQKYQDYKNKDTFRKYKKRLIEEGKDTNPDKFTTDVNVEKPIKNNQNDSLFGVLKSIYKNKINEHDKAEEYNAAERNRMKHKKPEIAIPDDELDELIDSLDIK